MKRTANGEPGPLVDCVWPMVYSSHVSDGSLDTFDRSSEPLPALVAVDAASGTRAIPVSLASSQVVVQVVGCPPAGAHTSGW
jgi:hypothetical protein